jgi:hypothetical protein
VASLLRQGDFQPTPSDLQIGSSEPTTEESSADRPLWLAMARAMNCLEPASSWSRERWAAVIETVRDRMVPEEPPLTEEEREDLMTWHRYWQRQYLRTQLSGQARIAREGE